MAKGWLKRGSKKNRFDWEDYDYLVGKGKTNTQIMERLWDNRKRLRSKDRQGRDGIFDRIQRRAQLDWKASTGWDSASGVDDWNFGLWGDKSFGKKDIRAALAGGDGASKYQIGQLYARAEKEGVKIDEWAQNWMKNVPESDWDYGAHGGLGFDMKDIKAMGDDYALEDIIKARDFASENKLTIGEGVAQHITGLQQDKLYEEMKPPGTQKGTRNVSGYNALGIRSPKTEGQDLNTGGITAAFGRKKKPNSSVNALSINPLT